MKLTFLGTGSAFNVGEENFQSNMLLSAPNGAHLLIDCGGDIRFSLHEQGLDFHDIRHVFISHLHSDHVGGLEWLAFSSKFNAEVPFKPHLHISERLVDDLWNKVLSGGLGSLSGSSATLSTYFEVLPVSAKMHFKWEEIDLQLVETIHVMTQDQLLSSFGLFFSVNGKRIFITTDTQFTPKHLGPFYKKADLIFHDCETAVLNSGCHARFESLIGLDPAIKKKMWLYHYDMEPLPDAKKEGFRGFVKKGQTFFLNNAVTYD